MGARHRRRTVLDDRAGHRLPLPAAVLRARPHRRGGERMTAGRHAWPEERQQPQSEGIRVRRWGMRLLGFLAIAFVAVVLSSVQHHYTVITALMVLVGLPGAAI